MREIKTDVLVIGGGMAAAQAAMAARKEGVIVDLVDKGTLGDSGSSPRCLVGFAAAIDELDKERFFQDWCKTSRYICDQNLVWTAIDHSQEARAMLEEMNVNFIKLPDGSYHLNKRAGMSVARGMMVNGDENGYANTLKEVRPMAEKLGVRFNEGHIVTKLLRKGDRVVGAVAFNKNGEPTIFNAKAVILASGGVNRLFPNLAKEIREPKYGTYGSSYFLAFNAGIPLQDMEFSQFRDSPPAGTIFGAPLLNNKRERFMEKIDPVNLEKAPRAVVATAVYNEIMAGRGPIIWEPNPEKEDLLAPVLKEYRGKKQVEIELQFQRCLGGARINERGETSLKGLYALGEAAGGSLGADRGQSLAFLEVTVYGMIGGKNAAQLVATLDNAEIEPGMYEDELKRIKSYNGDVEPETVIAEVQKVMWEKVGVVRNEKTLKEGIALFQKMRRDVVPKLSGKDLFAALNATTLIRAAEFVAQAALVRKESRGALNRSDYPQTSDKWVKHICINNADGEVAISFAPVVIGQVERKWVSRL
jgi:succinate dehydrogenase/fumarate reductase flavoprotein subunit